MAFLYLWTVDSRPRSRNPIRYISTLDLGNPNTFFDGKACHIRLDDHVESPVVIEEPLKHPLSVANRGREIWRKRISNKPSLPDNELCGCDSHGLKLRSCTRECYRKWKWLIAHREEKFNNIISLCTQVELMLEKALQRHWKRKDPLKIMWPGVDDMYERAKRDANRSSKTWDSTSSVASFLKPLKSEYVWAEPNKEKYRSRFNRMRNPDLVKDDLAYRKLRGKI